jgi:hypothetical protein
MENNDIASEGANTLSDVRRDPSPFIDHMSVKHQKFLSAIHLKVTHPDLPDWLNEMIDRSRRFDCIKSAMRGLLSVGSNDIEEAIRIANAMMEESK